jgi:hypothetical protein
VGSVHTDGLTAAGSAPVVSLLWLGRQASHSCRFYPADGQIWPQYKGTVARRIRRSVCGRGEDVLSIICTSSQPTSITKAYGFCHFER